MPESTFTKTSTPNPTFWRGGEKSDYTKPSPFAQKLAEKQAPAPQAENQG